jgi:hypothetical protein
MLIIVKDHDDIFTHVSSFFIKKAYFLPFLLKGHVCLFTA